jgi:hypothetical protein
VLLAVPKPTLAAPFVVSSPYASTETEMKSEIDYQTRGGSSSALTPKFVLAFPVLPRLALEIHGAFELRRRSRQSDSYGTGDSSISAKFTFLYPKENGLGLGAGIEPELSIPTGNAAEDLGSGRYEFYVPLMLSRQFGRVEVATELGVSHVFGENKNDATSAVLLMARATKNLRIGGELVLEGPAATLRNRQTQLSAGFKFDLRPGLQLYGLYGRGIARTDIGLEQRLKIGLKINPRPRINERRM